ncbi:MAG: hypothetical protein E6R09_13090 [Rhodocyclaceae bacterium]|nr:MAG: hypothetical protein E6R09_13090 [Rhodocyclaceae bacterium]
MVASLCLMANDNAVQRGRLLHATGCGASRHAPKCCDRPENYPKCNGEGATELAAACESC